jgi:hypothetical protein
LVNDIAVEEAVQSLPEHLRRGDATDLGGGDQAMMQLMGQPSPDTLAQQPTLHVSDRWPWRLGGWRGHESCGDIAANGLVVGLKPTSKLGLDPSQKLTGLAEQVRQLGCDHVIVTRTGPALVTRSLR